MKGKSAFWRGVELVVASAGITAVGAMGGCLTYPIEPQEPHTTSTVVARLQESAVDKIDLLLMIEAAGTVTTTTPGLVPSFKDMVLGTGQIGCGYEAQLESWYRFLVDPEPYATISIDSSGKAQPMGTDDVLLTQRKEFLRADSLLAILALTDENDCSTKETGQYWLSNQQLDPNNASRNFYLPKARTECATNPNDKCCASTGQTAPAGCPPEANTPLDAKTDDANLRCWDQKRRFGIDFLYPVDRYVAGLTQPLVPNRAGEMVANPIFSDLSGTSSNGVRDASLVFLAYIVGVPWQDIARDPTDLTKGFKNATELATADAKGHTTWDYIIGTPYPTNGAPPIAPLDPHMIEADAPRTGTDPLVAGATLSTPAGTEGGPDRGSVQRLLQRRRDEPRAPARPSRSRARRASRATRPDRKGRKLGLLLRDSTTPRHDHAELHGHDDAAKRARCMPMRRDEHDAGLRRQSARRLVLRRREHVADRGQSRHRQRLPRHREAARALRRARRSGDGLDAVHHVRGRRLGAVRIDAAA